MGKGSNLYFQQQQARQLRELEKHQAAQSGQPLRKLSWTERNVLGLRDEPAESDGESVLAQAKEEAERARLVRQEEKRARKQAGTARAALLGAGTAEGDPGMQVRGYLIDVTWDGQTLTVLPSNRAARVALLGPDHKEGALALEADEIGSTELKPATALINGRITVRTKGGRTYLLHFRRKSNTEFARLYKALPG